MQVRNIEKRDNHLYVKVESDAAEFESAVNSAYLKNKSSITIPGFRKGKAPRAVIEGMYGAEVFYSDAIDELASKAFIFAVESENVKFIGAPSISAADITDGRTVEYEFCLEPYPEVKLGEYKGLQVERVKLSASDEDVEKEIQTVRTRNARIVSIDDRPAQMGDIANIDYDGYLDGERFEGGKAEGHPLELGSCSFVPGFEEQLVGMTIGEEKDIDIIFPEDYHEHLAGKAVIFKVKLNGLTVRELPELDDEFVKDVSEFDTLDEYKADILKNIQKRYDDEAERFVRNQVVIKACENMTVEIPQLMINEKVEEIVRNYASNYGLKDRSIPIENLAKILGFDDEMLNTQIRPAAEMQVKSELLIDAVAKAECLEVTDEEAEKYLAAFADSVGAKVDEVREYFGMETIRSEKLKEKAQELLLASALITDIDASKHEKSEE